MDDKLKNALYERYTRSCRPQYFASWAKPKASELNILRHRHLDGNQEVIWGIAKDNGKAVDHIEMAGFYASAIISYGKNKDGELKLMKHLTVPTLRFKPDLTESSFSHNFNGCVAVIKQNGMALTEYPETVSVKGDLSIFHALATVLRSSAGSLPPLISPRLSRLLRFSTAPIKHRNMKCSAHITASR